MKTPAEHQVVHQDNANATTLGGKSMAPPAFQLMANPAAQPIQKKSSGGTAMKSIVLKRKNIHLGADDKYGHWWVELDGKQSFGWWPKHPVGLWDTLTGTEGELNGQTSFGGSATLDPHHGDSADEVLDVECTDASKSESDVQKDIITFASGYSGEWRWTFGLGQNCHTFQKQMLRATNLVEA